jgi:dynein heavy chain
LESLAEYKEKVNDLNKRKDELVLAEKLFNLPISTFKELVQIEEENKKLSVLYDVYNRLKTNIKEWSSMLWTKLDSEQLRIGSEDFDRQRKKLQRQFEDNTVF